MIIVKIKGGLGNQMFQYAFGRALSLERNEDLALDISHFSNQPEREAKRDFILDAYSIQATILPEETTQKYNSGLSLLLKKILAKIQKIDAYTFYPFLLKSRRTYFEGHWINEKYFVKHEDTIRKELSSLKNPFTKESSEIITQIDSSKSAGEVPVSLHIRRGDFVTNPYSAFNGVLGVPYYEKAFESLTKEHSVTNPHIFVFSDDIDWAKENLKLPCPMTFVSRKEIPDYEEVILMSKCTHHIIANSTFSWWGAWLNSNNEKIVIATQQWLKDRTTKELDLIAQGWRVI